MPLGNTCSTLLQVVAESCISFRNNYTSLPRPFAHSEAAQLPDCPLRARYDLTASSTYICNVFGSVLRYDTPQAH